jgi:hypothetical protein
VQPRFTSASRIDDGSCGNAAGASLLVARSAASQSWVTAVASNTAQHVMISARRSCDFIALNDGR